MIARFLDARVARTVGAAVDLPVRLDAVPDYSAVAVGTTRGERLDRALEAVESVGRAAGDSD
jgi:hypothetical protein